MGSLKAPIEQPAPELRDMSLDEGTRIAAKFFEKRGGRQKRVEVHVDQATLAALLAVAFELGFAAHAKSTKRDPI